MFIGCESQPPEEIVLHASLQPHYLLIQSGKTGSARVQLRQHMNEHGESSQSSFLMGFSYHKEKRYTKAVEWMNLSVSETFRDAWYPPTWHFLGWSYYYLGEAQHSKHAFETYLGFDPEEGDTLFGLGLLALDAGELEVAKSLFHRSIAAQSENSKGIAKAMSRLGDTLAMQNELLEARQMYVQAVDLDNNLYESWFRLASTYDPIEESAEREEALQKSIEAKKRFDASTHDTRFPE
jgi:tetratricopeptide (TPR) repeat protein